jgi:pimeloyl-ACP methyl ester carboxylesterase
MTDFVVHRGQRIAYDCTGTGNETVVLLHGLAQRRNDWAACGYVDALADEYQVVAIDSLGHGESDSPSDCSLYTSRERAGDVVAVLDALDVARAHIVGYSMGGVARVGDAGTRTGPPGVALLRWMGPRGWYGGRPLLCGAEAWRQAGL